MHPVGAEERISEGGKDVVATKDGEWPELQVNEGGKMDQKAVSQPEKGEKMGTETSLNEARMAPATESESNREAPKHVRPDEDRFLRSEGKGERRRPNGPAGRDGDRRQRPDNSAHFERGARDNRQGGASWENRRGGGGGGGGGRQGRSYDDTQRQKWTGHHRPEGGEGGDEGGADSRGGRKSGDQQDRANKREDHLSSGGGWSGRPRGGRTVEGYNRGEQARPSSDRSSAQRESAKNGIPRGSRAGEGLDSPPSESQRASEETGPLRPVDSGKPRSLFHTGESESTKATRVYTLNNEEGVQRLSVKMSGRGVGRGRGWKERLGSPKGEAGVVPMATPAGTQPPKSGFKVIEPLEQRLSAGKVATAPVAASATTVEPVSVVGVVTGPPSDKEVDSETAPKEKAVVGKKVGGSGGGVPAEEQGATEGVQGTKPKRYSSRRQKSGEGGADAVLGNEGKFLSLM